MYKHQFCNIQFQLLKKVSLLFFTFVLYLLFTISPSFAQSSESLDFTITIDKNTVSPSDTYTLTYNVNNKANSSTIYNAKINFNYLDKLEYSTFTGSSTGLSKDDLQNYGYNINSLDPGKNISFLIYFKVDSSAPVGQQIHFKENNLTTVTSSISFKFSQDSNAVGFTKDASVTLPSISNPKAEISSVKYPNGITGFDLSKLDGESAKNVDGFFLQGSANKITFNDSLDLSTPDALYLIKNLNQFIDLNTNGSINIVSNSVFNNKKATLEYKNISFIDTPILFSSDSKTDTKLDNKVTFDKTAKTATALITNTGKYTLVGEVKTEIPETTSGKFLHVTGTLTDPSARVETMVNDKSLPTPIVDLTTGSFTYDYTFDAPGDNKIIFNVYAKNGVVNKQTFTVNATGLDATTTPVPVTAAPVPKQETYIYAFLITLGVIFLLGIILAGYLTFISLKKRKNKELLSNLDNDETADTEVSSLQVVNFKKQAGLYNEASENRHEIIRDKVEKNLNDPNVEKEVINNEEKENQLDIKEENNDTSEPDKQNEQQ